MEKVGHQPLRKLLVDPVYKSALVYRPNEYYDDVAPKYNYYDEFYGADMEAQKEEEKKSILAEDMSAKRLKRRRTCSLCCCTLFYFTFVVLLVTGIVTIKLIPKDPVINIGDITNAEFVYNQTAAGLEQVHAGLSCGINVTNRNPYAKAIYQVMNIRLYYKDESLGSLIIGAPGPQFEQRKKMITTMTANVPITTTTIGAANAAALKSDVALKNVQLDLKGKVEGEFKVFGIKVKKFDTDLDCRINVRPGDTNAKPFLTCYVTN